MQDSANPPQCVICSEGVTLKDSSICDACGGRFHLNQRNDLAGKDCGAVWISDQHLALEFACQRCLALEGGAGNSTARPPAARRRYRKRS
jgi:hypothetical protein